MQLDTRLPQPLANGLQAGQRTGINQVDGRAHQHQVAHAGVFADLSGYLVFQIACVGKVQAFIHPDGQHAGALNHLMALHIAKVLGARQLADHCNVRLAGALEKQQQRQADAEQNTDFNPCQQHSQHGHGHGQRVRAGISPGATQCAEIDQAEHRHDDGRRQHRVGQVIQQRGEKQHGQGNPDGTEGTGHRCPRAGIMIDH